MKKMNRWILILGLAWAVFSLLPMASYAEEAGVVDIQKALAESEAGKDAQKRFMDKQVEWQDKLRKKADELNEMKGGGKKEVSAAKIAEKEAEIQLMQEDMGKDLQALNTKLSEEIKKKVDDVLLAVQKEKKLSMILEKKVVYAGGKDVTDEVTQRLKK